NGNIQEKTFRAGEKVNRAHVEHNTMQYLYASGDTHAFMDTNTYEQIELQTSQIEDELKFIKENMEVSIVTYEGEIIRITLQKNVLVRKESKQRYNGGQYNTIFKSLRKYT